ncbi:MAG: F0F1 ATP synthase subunit A [Patescibacteria group bacterium]
MNISLAAEPIFHLGGFKVTNTLLMSWLIIGFLFVITFISRRKLSAVPSGLQNIVEIGVEKLLNFMESVTGDRRQAKKFFPLVATIFIFVILSNWLEIVPGLGTIGIWEEHHGERILVPFIRSASADLNVTLGIAIISVFSIQIFGIMALGVFKYAGKFISFKGPIEFFVGILELISEIAKMISFSFRLFGNIFAGEVLLTIVLFLVPYLVPLPFLFLEIFVGFIQALVFSMLTLVFLKVATTGHDEHH